MHACKCTAKCLIFKNLNVHWHLCKSLINVHNSIIDLIKISKAKFNYASASKQIKVRQMFVYGCKLENN